MEKFREAHSYISGKISLVPDFGIILGTGLGHLADKMEVLQVLDYAEIPHFATSTVETHKGKLLFGYLNKAAVVVMQGRFHFYEGYSMEQVTFPVRVMKMLGIRKLLVSNVSGGINPGFKLGDLMVLEDHINLQTGNPLSGKNLDEFGPRFPDMLEPYDRKMIDYALEYGRNRGYRIHEGVYVSVPGPNLETRAEYRFLGRIGADAVGMSTVPEIIVARHMNIPCFALSAITDLCYEPELKKVRIEDILKVAAESEPKMTDIFEAIVNKF